MVCWRSLAAAQSTPSCGPHLKRVVLPRWPLACHWDKRETLVAEKNGSLPMGILRQALEIYSYFSELLGRNSRWVYLIISISFQNPLVHHPVFCYGLCVSVHHKLLLGSDRARLAVIQTGLTGCHFTFSFPQGCKISYKDLWCTFWLLQSTLRLQFLFMYSWLYSQNQTYML